jgi:hypothetical protein
MRAEWQVKVTAQEADGTITTTYREASKHCCTRGDEGSIRDKVAVFQQEIGIGTSGWDYEIFIHDGEVVPFWPKPEPDA